MARKGHALRAGALLALVLVALPGAADVRLPTVFLAPGWFAFGASDQALARARELCVEERLGVGRPLRSCAGEELFRDELPERRVYLSGYALDRTEVSQGALEACVAAGGCDPSAHVSGHPGLRGADYPAIGLSWHAARALCAFRGGRLPSEAEWERAARGDSARHFPWGFFYHPALANHGRPSSSLAAGPGEPSDEDGYMLLAESSAFGEAQSPHGLVQMAGNVWEWTADSFAGVQPQPLHVDPRVELNNGLRVVRGGSFRTPAFALRVTHREARPEIGAFVDVGVRCAYDSATGSRRGGPP